MKWYCSMRRIRCWLILFAGLIPSSFYSAACETSLPGAHTHNIHCIPQERDALLLFKQAIQFDRCGLLASWDEQQDCCQWQGVGCDDHSGHVVMLQLSGSAYYNSYHYLDYYHCLGGKLSPSLLELKHLKYLDLSYNDFNSTIPSFIGSLVNLEYLNLSYAYFQGEIRHQLANLSCLTSLDLNYNDGLYAKSLGWLSRLTWLTHLRLSDIDLSLATDWMQVIHNLPLLRVLHMESCLLSRPLMYVNISTNLRVLGLGSNNFYDTPVFQWVFSLTRSGARIVYLDLSENIIVGTMTEAISNLQHLEYLDLSGNGLLGNIPKSIRNLCSLQTLNLGCNSLTQELSSVVYSLSGCAHKSLLSLDLGYNEVWGSIPDTISIFSSLKEVYLYSNNLNGTISQSLGQLSMLERLHLHSNSLKGTLSEHHLSNLSRLHELYLEDNSDLVVNISTNWVPPFQLKEISLRSHKMPHFPNWLLTQKNVSYLDISDAGISDPLPVSFWDSFSSDLFYLNLSHNNIYGVLPNSSRTFDISSITYTAIDFSSNHLEGAIPSFFGSFGLVFLNNNMLSKSVELLCPRSKVRIIHLDLSNNFLSGPLPDCWQDFEYLAVLRLANNHFIGKLPTSVGALERIRELYIRNNSLVGEVPKSFEICTKLAILDLAYNSLIGQVPPGIGNLQELQILNLRSNNFNGELPSSLCQLSHFQILDLSFNHISGTIPKCIHNLTAMIKETNPASIRYFFPDSFLPNQFNDFGNYTMMTMWKGKEQKFKNTLRLVKYIAISDNQLQGNIPSEISFLRDLESLELAGNNLTGTIPSRIGELSSLQVLNLSSNHLFGEIPTSLTSVSYLEILDLSNNNLSGRIPQGTQLQGFDSATYMGNPGLCGPPLPKCPGDEASVNKPKGDDIIETEENESSDIRLGFYLSAVLGFIIGFWGVCGSLVLKRSWRQAYFQFLVEMKDRLHVMVAVNIAKVCRRP